MFFQLNESLKKMSQDILMQIEFFFKYFFAYSKTSEEKILFFFVIIKNNFLKFFKKIRSFIYSSFSTKTNIFLIKLNLRFLLMQKINSFFLLGFESE